MDEVPANTTINDDSTAPSRTPRRRSFLIDIGIFLLILCLISLFYQEDTILFLRNIASNTYVKDSILGSGHVVDVKQLPPGLDQELLPNVLQKSDDLIIMRSYFKENSYLDPNFIQQQGICANLKHLRNLQEQNPQSKAVLKFSANCSSYFSDSDHGVGDWLAAIYAMRMSALTYEKVGIYMQCDGSTGDQQSILPWVMGYFPAWEEVRSVSPFLSDLPSKEEACGNYETSPIGYMAPYMQFELRRMAIAIAGIPNDEHPSKAFAETYLWNSKYGVNQNRYQIPNPQPGDPPLVPNMELDDVAIQFSCSYVLGGKSGETIAFSAFDSYHNRIAPNVQSIGIITSNYGSNACTEYINALVVYLQKYFENARVTVRNDSSETLAMVYTRLIMANQTFGGLTAFGALPVVATFGTGYMMDPKANEHSKNKWVDMVANNFENVKIMEDAEQIELFVMKSWMKQSALGTEHVLYWLTTDDYSIKEPYPPEKNRIIEDTLVRDSDLSSNSLWSRDPSICRNLDETQKLAMEHDPPLKPELNFTINCGRLFKESELGTGNWLTGIYGIRLAALTHGGVGVHMACEDAWDQQTKLILPWVMGYWPSRESYQEFPWPHPDSPKGPMGLPNLEDTCGGYYQCPIGYMVPFIRHDLRRMAIAIGGIPDVLHPSYQYAKDYLWSDYYQDSKDKYQFPSPKQNDEPLIPGMEFDEVAIHFRCGDILGGSNHPSFGFMKFTAYKKWVSPEAKSIGIVTNPFHVGQQTRGRYSGNSRTKENCRIAVEDLKAYLEFEFPGAMVSIRNDISETILMSYTRLVMAKQTFTSISSFGIYPAMANFGTGYIKKPDFPKVPNQFITKASEMFDNIVLMDEPERLMARTVMSWLKEDNGMEKVLYWFRNENFKYTDPYPP